MSGFLEELGKKVAERWLTLFLLPGLLWTATLLAAIHLEHHHPFNIAPALDAATRWTEEPHTIATLTAVLAGLLLASSAAGLAVTGVAVLLRRLWTAPGLRPPAHWLTRWRQHRWTQRDIAARLTAETEARKVLSTSEPDSTDPDTPIRVTLSPVYAHKIARRDAISLERPTRPTWIGDRWQSTFTRVRRAYALDLTAAWPRLWTILPDNLRTDISTTQTAYTRASILTAWAVLYAIPAVYYWPATLVAPSVLFVGTLRARTTTDTLCTLVETATDLYTHALAQHLTTPDAETGNIINNQLRKEPPAR